MDDEMLTSKEIMAKIPELRPGSFRNFCLLAGIKKTGERPSKTRSHLKAFLFPADSVARIKAVMPGGGHGSNSDD